MALLASLFSPLLRHAADWRLGHFLLPVGLLLLALLLPQQLPDSETLSSVLAVLPGLLALLGGALCVVFARWRALMLMAMVYLACLVLAQHVDYFQRHRVPRGDSETVFLMLAMLLPACYGLYGLWHERLRNWLDLGLRVLVLVSGLLLAGWFCTYRAGEVRYALGTIWWPDWYGNWMHLPQLAYPLTAAMLVLLLLQYLREPRPQHAALLVALPALLWMLPKVFVQPYLLQLTTSAVLLVLIAALVHEFFHMAFRDELTGLPGRRALSERLQRLHGSYLLAVVDVDHFKRFNDNHGHDVGDQVLRMVASRLRRSVGGSAYRQGGEEFVIVLDGNDEERAESVLEALRASVADYRMQLRDVAQRPATTRQGRRLRGQASAPALSVTVSIGVAASNSVDGGVAEVLKRADQALYRAKQAGRNRVEWH